MSDDQNITVAPGGPYIVRGGVPVTTKTPIMSEHGEPLTWKTEGRHDDAKPMAALCRCGQSSTKPYCDGTHAKVEWDDTDNAPEGTYAERAKSYGGEGIEVLDDRPICVHAGFCGNQVTNVWKMAAKNGRQPDPSRGDGDDRAVSLRGAELHRRRRGDRARPSESKSPPFPTARSG